MCVNHDTLKTNQNSHLDARLVTGLSADFLKHYFLGDSKIFGGRIYVKMLFFFLTKVRGFCGDLFGVSRGGTRGS